MTDNRTTELREKLTERGVEWTKPKSAAEFIQTTFLHNGWGIEVLERNIGLCVTATNVFDTPEQAITATLGSGTLTAEQVRETVLKRGNVMGPRFYGDWQAIADELNAEVGGTCENVSCPPSGFLCSECGWGDFAEPSHLLTTAKFTGRDKGPNFCPNCGKAAER